MLGIQHHRLASAIKLALFSGVQIGRAVDTYEFTITDSAGDQVFRLIPQNTPFSATDYPHLAALYPLLITPVLPREAGQVNEYKIVADNVNPPIGMIYRSNEGKVYSDGVAVNDLLLADGSDIDPVLYPILYGVSAPQPANPQIVNADFTQGTTGWETGTGGTTLTVTDGVARISRGTSADWTYQVYQTGIVISEGINLIRLTGVTGTSLVFVYFIDALGDELYSAPSEWVGDDLLLTIPEGKGGLFTLDLRGQQSPKYFTVDEIQVLPTPVSLPINTSTDPLYPDYIVGDLT